jgi:hypothetical protein
MLSGDSGLWDCNRLTERKQGAGDRRDDTRGIRMTWTALPITSSGRFSLLGPSALFARIDNCGAKVLFEAATGRFF